MVNNINAQLAYLEYLVKMVKHLKPLESNSTGSDPLADATDVHVKDVYEDIHMLLKFLTQDFLSDRQKADILSEIYHLMSLIKLMDMWYKLRGHGKLPTVSQEDKLEAYCNGEAIAWQYLEDNEQKHSEILELIAKIKVKGLTEAERVEIMKAIGLSS